MFLTSISLPSAENLFEQQLTPPNAIKKDFFRRSQSSTHDILDATVTYRQSNHSVPLKFTQSLKKKSEDFFWKTLLLILRKTKSILAHGNNSPNVSRKTMQHSHSLHRAHYALKIKK